MIWLSVIAAVISILATLWKLWKDNKQPSGHQLDQAKEALTKLDNLLASGERPGPAARVLLRQARRRAEQVRAVAGNVAVTASDGEVFELCGRLSARCLAMGVSAAEEDEE